LQRKLPKVLWQRVHRQRDLAMDGSDQSCLAYIAPSKPIPHAVIESFIGRLRDEFLNETLFSSLIPTEKTLI
jgi:hypothetical protein